MIKTYLAGFVNEESGWCGTALIGLEHLPALDQNREQGLFASHALIHHIPAGRFDVGQITDGQNDHIFTLILFLKSLQMRKLRTTGVSARLPEVDQDDLSPMIGQICLLSIEPREGKIRGLPGLLHCSSLENFFV